MMTAPKYANSYFLKLSKNAEKMTAIRMKRSMFARWIRSVTGGENRQIIMRILTEVWDAFTKKYAAIALNVAIKKIPTKSACSTLMLKKLNSLSRG
jgi:hypothetical protein